MWSEIKPTLKAGRGGGGSSGNVEDPDYFPPPPCKDWSFGIVCIVKVLVIFMAGVVIGLSSSSHVAHIYKSHAELFFPSVVYTSGCDGDCGGFRSFAGSTQLLHTMEDKELLWRASQVPKMVEYPFQRVPKVAFLFLTRGPLPFVPLWDRFFKGHEGLYSVYVHALPEYTLNISKESAFFMRQVPSQETSWGSITLIDAERRLLANALLDNSNERFVLLSESCIPVYNFPTVYEYLVNSHQSYVESYNIQAPQCAGRYNRRMAPMITPAQWRKGSQWFELSRELAVAIIVDYKYHAIFRKYCRPSCYPDEHYIPTFLHLFHGSLNSNRSVTWVDWSRGGAHPATYGAENITAEFIQDIRINAPQCMYNNNTTSVCYLFARKFAPSALEPLLNLSSTLLEF